MDAKTVWKNFSLGKELDIAGSFIYNGLKAFDLMENFVHEDGIFEFFYNTAVGIERLEKILVILIEHNDTVDQKDFERSLKTHNHLELLNRITKKHNCGFNNLHNEFLKLLSSFYKTMRYDRYTLNTIYSHDKERVGLVSFLEKHLKTEIIYKDIFVTQNEWRFKKFIGKVVGKICEVLYKLIDKEATALNIYTYELRSESKASVIFLAKKYNFFEDDIVWKEILIYLINNADSSGILDFIRRIEPLNLEPELVNEYINVFKSDLKKHSYIYDLEEQYYEIENTKERFEMLGLLGNSNVHFEQSENEEEAIDDYQDEGDTE
ncbi:MULTISPECIES: hypothetical protein [unclassified Paenibacillus]|uniref:hypothetical protein n=1 Tax=unclassified Paenibacillus TaxID=185978 RepID=UPI0009A60656|nr:MULTISPECIES: hypothetical protein [unclassified Paenibacillus]SLK12955.1 hypothetical protein SAMN06272722_10824 [Paenibacillus sp. RU5A]SOC72799.1 hypothetical protein SAMN05880581_10824 [Paenibacillus sp. RU26A]SOC75054.1 hypothetical protein SAMN05880586_10824 [Paenibacillus sp. RU5M]